MKKKLSEILERTMKKIVEEDDNPGSQEKAFNFILDNYNNYRMKLELLGQDLEVISDFEKISDFTIGVLRKRKSLKKTSSKSIR
jgi:hypothetical protein